MRYSLYFMPQLSERDMLKIAVVFALYLTSLFASNTLGLKVIPFLGTHISTAIFMFPFVFITTDVIGEVYGRRIRYEKAYADPLLPIPANDLRIGGRITLDAWVGRTVRLFAAYDVSSAIGLYPEINGYRSLRLMLTGIY